MAESYLPDFLEPKLTEQYGELAALIMEGYFAYRATTLRANTMKATREEVAAALEEAGIAWQPVAWYGDAFAVAAGSEKLLWDTPVYKEGKLYLQSLSSMLPPLAMGVAAGKDVLDMCAAPGGKTTQMAALGGRGCRITACELNVPRAEKLEHNLSKQGASNVVVMREDARRLSEFFSFDQILLDAPCSGSGTLRAESPGTAKHFTEKLIAKSVKSQTALLDKALELLKPGSTCLYSTCSVLECENEAIVRAVLKKAGKRAKFEVVETGLEEFFSPVADGADRSSTDVIPTLPTTLEGAVCVCPTERFEGFFMTKIKRTA